ncbi:MAG: hypothetical protein HYT11_02410, partial [Candidatus Levybacteria bacterium]|nr:hypothetical protein [Candidatus Levybacteria bacterium]
MTSHSDLTQECYKQSISLLLKNTTPHGLLAAAPDSEEGKTKNYTSL